MFKLFRMSRKPAQLGQLKSIYISEFLPESMVGLVGQNGFQVVEPRTGDRKGSIALSRISPLTIDKDQQFGGGNNPVEHAVSDVTN